MTKEVSYLIDINSVNHLFIELDSKELTGIYFLKQKDQLVYIGQTTKGVSRILEHKDKEFDKFYFIKCDKKDLNKIEGINILNYKPKLNRDIFCYKDKTINEISTICYRLTEVRDLRLVKKIIKNLKCKTFIQNSIIYIDKDDVLSIVNEFKITIVKIHNVENHNCENQYH